MQSSTPFLHFLTLLLFKQKRKHIATLMISIVIIALLSSVLFISSSLQHTLLGTLEQQADFTVTKTQAGRAVKTPIAWVDEIVEIKGTSHVTPRVYGRYFYAPGEESFLIIGIDFFDQQASEQFGQLLEGMDLKQFFSEESMVVGEGVKRFLKGHYYTDSFSFKTPQGKFKKVKLYETLPGTSNLLSNDVVIMPIELAREIFGMDEEEVTDITFNVPNDAEWDTIVGKLHLISYDVRVVEKREMTKAYEHLYNYKGGVFLILFIIVLLTFMMILYQRYTMTYSMERKEIGILRAVGWSIKEVLKLKFFETLIVVMSSYIFGVVLAYIYVFIFNAPILSMIFLGGSNLPNDVTFIPWIETGLLSTIFLCYAVPFFAAVLIPAWRVAVISPSEAMR